MGRLRKDGQKEAEIFRHARAVLAVLKDHLTMAVDWPISSYTNVQIAVGTGINKGVETQNRFEKHCGDTSPRPESKYSRGARAPDNGPCLHKPVREMPAGNHRKQ